MTDLELSVHVEVTARCRNEEESRLEGIITNLICDFSAVMWMIIYSKFVVRNSLRYDM